MKNAIIIVLTAAVAAIFFQILEHGWPRTARIEEPRVGSLTCLNEKGEPIYEVYGTAKPIIKGNYWAIEPNRGESTQPFNESTASMISGTCIFKPLLNKGNAK